LQYHLNEEGLVTKKEMIWSYTNGRTPKEAVPTQIVGKRITIQGM
jgi:hypothetical protein